MIRYLKNERGSSVIPFTALFAMAMVILMVLLMMWVSAEITLMNIRNSVKNELTNGGTVNRFLSGVFIFMLRYITPLLIFYIFIKNIAG